MVYAGFWPRFCAGFIDFLVFLPFLIANLWLGSLSKTLAILFVVPTSIFYVAYEVYFHGRFGQTLGKRAVGIRVVTQEGTPISWNQALVRSSVSIVFSLLTMAASLIAYLHFPYAQYNALGWWQRQTKLADFFPSWGHTVSTASSIWSWSEVLVVLFNKKKRALHDFMAGTVVIEVKREVSTQPQAPIPNPSG
ncbi:MAG TPA: RDD family protein [Abditibacteriaceae bacterium]|jgi:uncharacterized RDD family membrane protein YckC